MMKQTKKFWTLNGITPTVTQQEWLVDILIDYTVRKKM